jgi:hypothetical protein
MDIATFLMLATVTAAQPAPPTHGEVGARTPIRCRPAPYYVAERDGKQVPRLLLERGASIPVLDKRGRPCHLTRKASEGKTTFRVADH